MDITTKNMRALLINVLLGISVIAAVFAAIGGGWSLAKYTGFLPLRKAKKALVIDQTPITVEHVKAIGELGYYAPEDIKLISFDNTPYSTLSSPSITAIDRNAKDIAYKASDTLLKLIDKEKTEETNIIPVSLVKRDSTR